MIYNFSICDLHIRVQTERELALGEESQMFVEPQTPADVCLTLDEVDKVSIPNGTLCKSPNEYPTYRNNDLISRCSWDMFRPEIHFRTNYCLETPNKRRCSIRREDWSWATRDKYLWPGIMLNTLLLHNQGMILHGSYIGYKGEGLIFTAPSGTGKSTQAKLWQQYRRAEILNGDKVGVRLINKPMAHGVPFSGTSGICENVSLPLRAIVVLSQASENTIYKLSPIKAIEALFSNVFVDQAIHEEWQLALQVLLELVTTIPVYALACTPDEKAVELLEQTLELV